MKRYIYAAVAALMPGAGRGIVGLGTCGAAATRQLRNDPTSAITSEQGRTAWAAGRTRISRGNWNLILTRLPIP